MCKRQRELLLRPLRSGTLRCRFHPLSQHVAIVVAVVELLVSLLDRLDLPS